MRLYHSPIAPNARRVRMFLAEKGIEVPLVAVDLAKLEQQQRRLQRGQSVPDSCRRWNSTTAR